MRCPAGSPLIVRRGSTKTRQCRKADRRTTNPAQPLVLGRPRSGWAALGNRDDAPAETERSKSETRPCGFRTRRRLMPGYGYRRSRLTARWILRVASGLVRGVRPPASRWKVQSLDTAGAAVALPRPRVVRVTSGNSRGQRSTAIKSIEEINAWPGPHPLIWWETQTAKSRVGLNSPSIRIQRDRELVPAADRSGRYFSPDEGMQ